MPVQRRVCIKLVVFVNPLNLKNAGDYGRARLPRRTHRSEGAWKSAFAFKFRVWGISGMKVSSYYHTFRFEGPGVQPAEELTRCFTHILFWGSNRGLCKPGPWSLSCLLEVTTREGGFQAPVSRTDGCDELSSRESTVCCFWHFSNVVSMFCCRIKGLETLADIIGTGIFCLIVFVGSFFPGFVILWSAKPGGHNIILNLKPLPQ